MKILDQVERILASDAAEWVADLFKSVVARLIADHLGKLLRKGDERQDVLVEVGTGKLVVVGQTAKAIGIPSAEAFGLPSIFVSPPTA